MATLNPFKFNSNATSTIESIKGSIAYKLREKLNNGGKLTREEKNWVTEKCNSNAYFKDSVPVLGWRIPFSDVLHPFLVKQYNEWCGHEIYAIDKTAIRTMVTGKIQSIIRIS